ncbi:MAG: hypothetical protein RBU30_16680 [Polyangia bacterium]|nr:hypothetical protein [Polyangia bacterium]
MTHRAAQHLQLLHRWLVRVHGLPLGSYEPLRLDTSLVPTVLREPLIRHLGELDPVHGYRPDADGRNRAASWLLAGAVLEGMPFSRSRHHFLDPRTGRGLRNASGKAGTALRLRFLDFSEGQGDLGGIFTGANFDLTGMSVLRWARHPDNAFNLERHLAHRVASFTAPTLAARRHNLAMSLISLGALLHLVQEMAVPAMVRNDFVASYLEQRSNIALDRASAFEILVRRRYGRNGIPRVSPGDALPPFGRFDDHFTNSARSGLADRTQASFFSLGSLPRPLRLRDNDTEQSATHAMSRSLPYPSPALGRLHLMRSARTGEAFYHGSSTNPYLIAYRVSRQGIVQVTLDDRCHEAAAERLVPEAVRYSAALLGFLLRGELITKLSADGRNLHVTHSGPALRSGTLSLLGEDSAGRRTLLKAATIGAPMSRPSDLLASFDLSNLPSSVKTIVVVLQGTDISKEPLVLGASLPRRASDKP